jgi:hypothetical protein
LKLSSPLDDSMPRNLNRRKTVTAKHLKPIDGGH